MVMDIDYVNVDVVNDMFSVSDTDLQKVDVLLVNFFFKCITQVTDIQMAGNFKTSGNNLSQLPISWICLTGEQQTSRSFTFHLVFFRLFLFCPHVSLFILLLSFASCATILHLILLSFLLLLLLLSYVAVLGSIGWSCAKVIDHRETI